MYPVKTSEKNTWKAPATSSLRSGWRDFFSLWGLYITCFLVVYIAPATAKYPFFLLLLVLFARSKNNVLWFALYFLLVSRIGELFPLTRPEEGYVARLPIYNFALLRLPFVDLFLFVAFLKAIFCKQRHTYIVAKWFILLTIYLFLLYALSVGFGMSVENHIYTIRSLLPLTLIYSMPRLINKNEKEFYRLFYLLSTAMFVVLAAQVFVLVFGVSLNSYITGVDEVSVYEKIYIRLGMSAYLNISVFVLALFFYAKTRQNNTYLSILIGICVFSIFLSGTRGWIIAYFCVLVLFFVNQGGIKVRQLGSIIIPVALVLALIQIPVVKTAVDSVTQRTQTIYALAEGDLTADGTLKRYDQRAPRVMSKFPESPLFGFGFSDEYWEYGDGHVGHQNLLLQTGIIGTLLFYLLIFSFFFQVLIYRKMMVSKTERQAVMVFLIAIVGVILIHSSSTQFIGYILMFSQIEKMLFYAVFFTYADFYLKQMVNNQHIKSNASYE